MARAFVRVVPMLVVMATIFYLSHQPGDTLHMPQFWCADKVFHAIAYGALAMSILLAGQPVSAGNSRLAVGGAVVGVCLVYGILDEFHQSFIPRRDASVFDVLADVIGALLVVVGWSFFLKKGRA